MPTDEAGDSGRGDHAVVSNTVTAMRAKFGPIRQIAYIVEDLDASVRHWMQFAGVGPWTVFRNARMNGQCRGIATTVQMHVALSYQADMQIELIQVTSRSPSPYQGASGHPLIGMHHIARHSTDLDSDIAAAEAVGLRAAFTASNGVVRVAYMESAREPGLLLEFIEAAPSVLEDFAAGVVAARDWDGHSAAIRTVDLGV